ncbi:MAG: restriction endonuclease subunit S [Methyloprofundus sp.]|nr:restriction endonuclease subunit S [Methyloprofundus sp.]
MSNFKPVQLNKIAEFNPPESLPVGTVSRKIPMAQLKEFQRKIIGYETAEYKSGPKFRNSDTLVAKITPCLENGKTAYVDILDDGEVAFGSSEFIVLRTKDRTSPEFLFYLAISPAFRARAISCMEGTSGRKRVNEGVLKLYELPIPSPEEQVKIAAILSALDKKIELNNLINAELEAMAKTLYDYWFVQFDFPDDSPQGQGKPYKTSGGKMVYNPTLKREIPEGWKVKKLADVTSLIRRGISPKYTDEGGISVLNQKCVRNQKISFEDARRHKIELDDEDERLLKPFDVVVNSTGVGTLGRVAYVKRLPEKKTTVDSHVSIVRAKSELLSPLYLAWKLMRHQPVIESAANGSTGQVELSKSFLEDIDVIIPSDSIVKRFEEFVTPLVPELASRESENEQLVQLRDWLLPMLMNGQVTVK